MSEPREKIVELVKIKSWYVPADADSYRLLRAMKVPLLKIHRDFLPTLKLATSLRGVRARATEFSTLLEKRLDQMGEAWKRRPGRTCKLTDRRLVFSAPCSDRNRRAIAALDASFAKFCARWGFKYVPLYSERDDRMRLVIDFEFDPSRNPVIATEGGPIETAFELVLGFTKIKLTLMDKPASTTKYVGSNLPPVIHLEVFSQAGPGWKSVHTSTFVDQQIGDPSQFLVAMSHLFNRREFTAAETKIVVAQPVLAAGTDFLLPDQEANRKMLFKLLLQRDEWASAINSKQVGYHSGTGSDGTFFVADKTSELIAAYIKHSTIEKRYTNVPELTQVSIWEQKGDQLLSQLLLKDMMGLRTEPDSNSVTRLMYPAVVSNQLKTSRSRKLWLGLARRAVCSTAYGAAYFSDQGPEPQFINPEAVAWTEADFNAWAKVLDLDTVNKFLIFKKDK